jgi:hypothetical protein
MGDAFEDELGVLRHEADKLRDPYAEPSGMPNCVYHYCSVGAAIQIIPSRTLWASNVAHSNDPSEIRYGQALLRTVIRQSFPHFAFRGLFQLVAEIDFYAACFSAEGDLLPQWRAYCGNGRGVSLGALTSVLAQHKSMLFVRVEYDPVKQRQLVAATVNIYQPSILAAAGNNNKLAAFLGELALHFVVLKGMFKSPAYKSEREYRLFNTLPRTYAAHATPLKYRAAGSSGAILVPYYDVSVSNSRAPQAPTPFCDIVMGPCLPFRNTRDGLRLLLDQWNLPSAQISRSKVRMNCA